jgi:hypothetical protein
MCLCVAHLTVHRNSKLLGFLPEFERNPSEWKILFSSENSWFSQYAEYHLLLCQLGVSFCCVFVVFSCLPSACASLHTRCISQGCPYVCHLLLQQKLSRIPKFSISWGVRSIIQRHIGLSQGQKGTRGNRCLEGMEATSDVFV